MLGGVDVPRNVGSFDLPSFCEDKYKPERFDPVLNRRGEVLRSLAQERRVSLSHAGTSRSEEAPGFDARSQQV